jgi:hypothetical protein
MKEHKTPSKLTRAQLRESLDSVPVSHILGKGVTRELTGKQKKFCLEVAKGETKANAYRKAYNVKSKNTLQREPYQLTRDQRITNEIEAMQAAIKAQEYQTPAALRALVIQSLVGVITNPDAQPGQITAAAKVLGTVTEVAAFTERKEVRTITSSEDARAAIMAQLKQLSNSSAIDVTAIDRDADSLLAELTTSKPDGPSDAKPGEADPHRTPTPQTDSEESLGSIHTIPNKRSPSSSLSEDIDPENPDGETPPPSTQETPPSSAKT